MLSLFIFTESSHAGRWSVLSTLATASCW